MRSTQARLLASVLATLSVVASLVFVALELRQNTMAVRASTYDRLAEQSAVYLNQIATDPELAALFRRVFDGELRDDFDPVENTRIVAVELAFLLHLENSYRQFRAGVVDEDVFESYGWGDGLLRSPHFLEEWVEGGFEEYVDAGFLSFMGSRLGLPAR